MCMARPVTKSMQIDDNDIAATQEVGDYPLLAFKEPRPAFLIPVATCVRYSQQLALIPLADRIQPSLHGTQNDKSGLGFNCTWLGIPSANNNACAELGRFC